MGSPCEFCLFILYLSQVLWNRDAKPIYGATMSFNRFAYLLSHLRLDDKDTREERRAHDKFAPARFVALINSYEVVFCTYVM